MAGYSRTRLASLWEQAGGSRRLAPTMAAIALAESGGDPRATNVDSNGTVDRGLWQINSSHGYGAASFVPLENAREAVSVERSQGLGAWTTYASGAYRRFMQASGSSGGGGRRRRRASNNWGVFSGPFAGVDQGTDWSGAGPIPALGRGRVTYVGESSIIEGGMYPVVVYELADAPPLAPSAYVYVAENFQPTVRKGKRLKEGTIIGEAPGKYPYIEVGFNRGPTGWDPVAPLNPNPHGPKAAGYAMQQLITERVTGVPVVLTGSRTPAPLQPGTRTRPGGGGGGGGDGILGFFESVGADIGSAGGWLAAGAEADASAVGSAASAAWNDTAGAVSGALDFLRAALWLVNPLNWLRAFEALVGVGLIAASIAIFVGADKIPTPGDGGDIPVPAIPVE